MRNGLDYRTNYQLIIKAPAIPLAIGRPYCLQVTIYLSANMPQITLPAKAPKLRNPKANDKSSMLVCRRSLKSGSVGLATEMIMPCNRGREVKI